MRRTVASKIANERNSRRPPSQGLRSAAGAVREGGATRASYTSETRVLVQGQRRPTRASYATWADEYARWYGNTRTKSLSIRAKYMQRSGSYIIHGELTVRAYL
ncbi:hypothetical protein MRX96_022166 [Rhipicephalus microplus]